MKRLLLVLSLAGLLLLVYMATAQRQAGISADRPVAVQVLETAGDTAEGDPAMTGTVLDISVHTLEELKVLLDRAEELALRPQPQGYRARVVLVLHGPEVEFFSIRNYPMYKDIVDQAARLDAFDVVDVKICQTMLQRQGLEQNDIPAFIEQVPYGPGEVERLVREGYVYF